MAAGHPRLWRFAEAPSLPNSPALALAVSYRNKMLNQVSPSPYVILFILFVSSSATWAKLFPEKQSRFSAANALYKSFLMAPSGSFAELPAQPFLPGLPEKLLFNPGSLSGDLRFEWTSAASPTCFKPRRWDSKYHKVGKKSIRLRRRAT